MLSSLNSQVSRQSDLLLLDLTRYCSVFKQHKLEHLAAKKDPATSSSPKADPAKPPPPQSSKEKPDRPRPKRREEKQIDFVDLGDVSDEEEVTDVTQKKVLEKTIPCPSCDVMFATNMSLKMHLNLQHPVKAEVRNPRFLIPSLYCLLAGHRYGAPSD